MEHKHIQPSDTQEISLRLEQYEDIFSDFDIRPYSKRSLSVDFLDEIKRATHDKDVGGIDLTLHVPEKVRNESQEETIRERLSAHFKRHHTLVMEEKRAVVKLGKRMITLGILAIGVASLITFFESPDKNLLLTFLVAFLEPAGVFMLWEGMDLIIFGSREKNPELHFYRKMSDARGHIHFKSY